MIIKNLNLLNGLNLKQELAGGSVMCPDVGCWVVPAAWGWAATGSSRMAAQRSSAIHMAPPKSPREGEKKSASKTSEMK